MVIGVNVDNIKHQSGEYTFLTGRASEYQWIRTTDLHNTYEEAKNAPVAHFYRGEEH